MLKVANSVISATRITGTLPVANGGTGVTTSTGTGNTVLSAAPTLSGDVNLSTGNLIPSTAAKGVNFTANTPKAGMTSQLLNWYEEGTWTPTDASGAGLILTINGSQFYTRVGRTVTASFNITYPVTVSGTAAILAGFPFTSVAMGHQAVIFNSLNLIATLASSSTTLYLYLTSTYAQVNNSQLSTLNMQGTITYQCV